MRLAALALLAGCCPGESTGEAWYAVEDTGVVDTASDADCIAGCHPYMDHVQYCAFERRDGQLGVECVGTVHYGCR